MFWGIFRISKTSALAMGLLSVSFLLMGFHVTETVRSIRTAILYWVCPAYELPFKIARAPSNLSVRLYEIVRAHRENQILKEKLNRFSLLEQEFKETKMENERWRALLSFRSRLPFRTAAAQVIAKDPHHWSGDLFIDCGAEAGVVEDAPVVAIVGDPVSHQNVKNALVGRILESKDSSSRVLLLSDPLSSVSVVFPRIGEQGLLQGQGDQSMIVEYIDQLAQVAVGDEVVTSGLGGIFPPGLAIGKVSDVLTLKGGFKRAQVEPNVRAGQIREVLVLVRKNSQIP